MTLEEIKKTIHGEWKSIAVEIRPSSTKNTDGSLKAFYLTRTFTYIDGDLFELEVLNFADATGNIPLAKMFIKGHIIWNGEHPIAKGAQKVEFIADQIYEVTPLIQGFADVMNQLAGTGFDTWEVNHAQSILRKKFIPFGLSEGQIFKEYDLIYLFNDMLFWGARNIDGRGLTQKQTGLRTCRFQWCERNKNIILAL